jgi:hypothetical protein
MAAAARLRRLSFVPEVLIGGIVWGALGISVWKAVFGTWNPSWAVDVGICVFGATVPVLLMFAHRRPIAFGRGLYLASAFPIAAAIRVSPSWLVTLPFVLLVPAVVIAAATSEEGYRPVPRKRRPSAA